LSVYGKGDVAPRLLRLQDKHGLNVNLLLWCLWCGVHFEEPPEIVIRKAVDLTGGWNKDVTARLRAARRALKSAPSGAPAKSVAALGERLKVEELEAERIEQEMLENLSANALKRTPSEDAGASRGRRNLAAYARLAGAAKSPGFSVSLLEELIENTLRLVENEQDVAS